ncbi:hypothetical protein 1 [Sanxia tombus-like virus 3]|uniref:hypothetical protein 1 n=1 Tax=Sanxia tombus-like virus 3 TaxID=1923387 RepID=UPI00090A7675|nr:hypothetical protein 1 [Sanxia tombus-like virus 3]APG76442.1 hypothetical protein 1 [Sanxia tombus-like virus 3]
MLEGVDTVPGVYPGISPTKLPGIPKNRKYLTMGQYICDYEVRTHNNSLNNLIRGVGERVLYTDKNCTPCIKPARGGIFRDRCGVYMRTIAQRLGHQSPVSRQQFVEFYSGRRRAMYQKAVDGLALKPIRVLDSHLSTFIKAEKLIFTLKPDPAPRVIQPRRPVYNVEVGKYLRPLESRIYDEIDNIFRSPTIMSKHNSVKQAEIIVSKWQQFQQPACVGLDASRFDQHVSEQALKFEHELYNSVFKCKRLAKLLTWQINNVGHARAADGKFTYRTKGSRMSGDMNTSLGNKFLMCLMCKAYIDTKRIKIDFVNNGDDCLMFLERKHLSQLHNLQSYFADFGFKMVTEAPVFELEHIEFCQSRPLKCNGIWRMTRNIRTCLARDVTAVNFGHDVCMYRAWLHDIANCGLAFAGDCPVYGSFYRMLLRFGVEGNYHDRHDAYFNVYRTMSRGIDVETNQPDDYGRYSFWMQTGINPDAQFELEQYFDNAVWGGDKRQFITNLSRLITHGS